MSRRRSPRNSLPAFALAAGLIGFTGTSSQVPATAQNIDTAGFVVELERTVVALERRIEPFEGAVVAETGDEVQVSLDADVLFEFDEAALTSVAEQTLTDLVPVIDDRLAGNEIRVVGHTDAKGDDQYNLDLSTRRAEAVRDYLSGLIDADIDFVVEGRGEAEPVAPNELDDGSDNPDGRRRNRRVELSFDAEPVE